MKLSEQRDIAAPPEVVWTALIDGDTLKECIPGCQEMTGSPEDGFEAVVTQKVGPVKATFRGRVTLTDIDPGRGCIISGEGKGGAAGFAKGGAAIRLRPSGAGTTLAYDAEASVGGKLAQLGGRVIDGVAKRMADQFFGRFQEVVERRHCGAADASGSAAPAVAAPDDGAPDDASRGTGIGRLGD